MRLFLLPSVVAVIVTSGCGRGGPPPPPAPAVPVLSTNRVLYSDQTGFRDSLRSVIRDPSSWVQAWQRATANEPAPPGLPTIDFTREMVIIVAAGRMNPGDAIRVDSVGVQGDLVVATVSVITECDPFPGEAYPMEIVRVTRDDRVVTFRDQRRRAAHCNDAEERSGIEGVSLSRERVYRPRRSRNAR